ncbi:hypothetical protein [Mucilaginibacter humi]|uniref:hypothetical protein n=1 Tax=Mucilaginibacter humi TaxID=2732510 RepID=UPI001C2F095A|nr:hypothetical protein [Mucilaginibacter humi]
MQIDAMEKEWEKARVDGSITGNTITLKTQNVTSVSVVMNQLPKHFAVGDKLTIIIDGTVLKTGVLAENDTLTSHKDGARWTAGIITYPQLLKRHDLQGPVDDAFTSAFIVVKPSGTSKNALFDKWSKAEMNRFVEQWRMQFRGDPVVKMDYELTAADMAVNLIAFGDAQSNKLIAKLNAKLPIKWTANNIQAGSATYSAKDHGLIMIYPNPLNQRHYIVLNSGFTFREDAYLNNSKQIPMLPDWAVVDLNTPPDFVHPGKIENAGFFGEHWELKKMVKE